MNVREFAEMLLKLPDQEAIVQVVDGDEYVDFSEDKEECHLEYFPYSLNTGRTATPDRYGTRRLQIGYPWQE